MVPRDRIRPAWMFQSSFLKRNVASEDVKDVEFLRGVSILVPKKERCVYVIPLGIR